MLLILAAAELLPELVTLWYRETQVSMAFASTAAITGLLGLVFLYFGRGAGPLYRREGILIVVAGWALASMSGALPYLLTGTVQSPIDALFESASGFTTTGASIMTDIEAASRGILFWRSFTQWLGGMGIVVLFVALLPELGPGARFVYKLEVPGPTAETLHPRVADTAKALWRIYLGLTGALVVLLLLAGLTPYDAVTHAFSTLSTGGFSSHNASVAAFESPLVEGLIIVFMVIAGVNFSLYYGLRRNHGRRLWTDPEFRIYLGVIVGFTAWISWDLLVSGPFGDRGKGQLVLDAAFQVASLITTTGYATADFDQWPSVSRVLLVILMFLGGCAGSTAGGPKIIRMVMGFKAALREARLIFSPNSIVPIFIGRKAVPESVVRSVVGFFVLYVTIWGVGTVLLTIGGVGLKTSATAAIATLGNIGPGLDAVGPTANFAFFSGWQKLVMVVLMWLGRLEVYAIAALAIPAFWRR